MSSHTRHNPTITNLLSPMSLPTSPAAYATRRLCPSSLLHPSSHAEYLLRHLEKPVTREIIRTHLASSLFRAALLTRKLGYVVCRIHQILSHTPVADFEPEPIAVPPLETFASVLIKSTFITLPTIICALLYLDRLELSLSSRPIYSESFSATRMLRGITSLMIQITTPLPLTAFFSLSSLSPPNIKTTRLSPTRPGATRSRGRLNDASSANRALSRCLSRTCSL